FVPADEAKIELEKMREELRVCEARCDALKRRINSIIDILVKYLKKEMNAQETVLELVWELRLKLEERGIDLSKLFANYR
ncbi:MAG: hypothetical protein QN229_07395, partial [Desulfurococcaceae archaeon TW002]